MVTVIDWTGRILTAREQRELEGVAPSTADDPDEDEDDEEDAP